MIQATSRTALQLSLTKSFRLPGSIGDMRPPLHFCILLFTSLLIGMSALYTDIRHVVGRPSNPDDLNQALRRWVEQLRRNMTQQIPLIGNITLEPLQLEYLPTDIDLLVDEGLHNLIFRGFMWDVTVNNLSAFDVQQLNMSVNVFSLDATLQSTFMWPDICISGYYDVDGILEGIMTFFGKGPFLVDVKNIRISSILKLDSQDGLVFAKSFSLDIKLEEIMMNFSGLLGGGEVGAVINQVMSKVSGFLFNVIASQVESMAEEAILTFSNERIFVNVTWWDLLENLANAK